MSDKLLERIAVALEKIADTKAAAPAAATKETKTATTAPKANAGKQGEGTTANKTAAGGKAPAGGAPNPKQAEMRKLLQTIANDATHGKDAALAILEEVTGVKNINGAKPEHYDTVIEKAKALLGEPSSADDDDLL